MQIGSTSITSGGRPYVIAEAGSNFNQDFATALRLIDVAAEAGADAVKFQLFSAAALYPETDPLYAIFKSVELAADWVPRLQEHAEQAGLVFAASAFDEGSLDVLEMAGVRMHKVASSETTNIRLLHRIARSGKPVVISTGMCDMADVSAALEIFNAVGNREYALLQCVTEYPLAPELSNLRVIRTLREAYGCPVGFSDHTLGTVTAVAAVGLEACIFEKHFTLDRSHPGPDHFYALEPEELRQYVRQLREAQQAMGDGRKDMTATERKQGRREGLYAARHLRQGEAIAAADLVARRPALGIRQRFAGSLPGMKCAHDIEEGAPILWTDLE